MVLDIKTLLVLFVLYKLMSHGIYFVTRLLDIKYKPMIVEHTVIDIYSKTVKHSLHWFDFHLWSINLLAFLGMIKVLH